MKKNIIPVLMLAAILLGSCSPSSPKRKRSSSELTSNTQQTSVTSETSPISSSQVSITSTTSNTSVSSSSTRPSTSITSITSHTSATSITTSVDPVKPTITKVTINPSSVSPMKKGDSVNLQAIVEGIGDYNHDVTWSVSDSSIIQLVITSGSTSTIIAKDPGTALIIATSVGDTKVSNSISVTVLEPSDPDKITGIHLDKNNDVHLEMNERYTLTATVEGTGQYNHDVLWSTSSSGIISYTGENTITITGLIPGTTTLTARPKSETSYSVSINITVESDFVLTHPMSYEKVTSASDLALGEHYFIASRDVSKAMSTTYNSSNNKPMSEDILKEGNLINNVIGTEIMTFRLVSGSTSNSYAFNYVNGASNYYLQSSANDLKKASKVDSSTSWDITYTGEDVLITSIAQYSIDNFNQNVYLKYNSQGSLFSSYPAKSVVGQVDLYKYKAGKEFISTLKDEYDIGVNTSNFSISVTPHGFAPTSYIWESLNSSLINVTGNKNEASISTKSSSGDAYIRCTATDNNISTSIDILFHIKEYSYIDLDNGDYSIVFIDTALSKDNLKAGIPFVPNDANCYFSFNKAFAGDNTYYITANNQYLGLSDNQYRIKLLDTKFVWTIIYNNDGTYTLSGIDGGKTKYLTYNPGNTNKWGADEDSSNNVLLIGTCSYKETYVDTSKMKQTTFNDDEVFDPSGLSVVMEYDTSTQSFYAENITDKIIWNSTYEENGINGKYYIEIYEFIVFVPLTITHYRLDSLLLDSSNTQIKYQVGESVNISGLLITGHYIDNTTSLSIDKEISINDVDYSPKTIAKDTDRITISYNNHTAYYLIETPQEVRFQLNDHIKKGDRIVFTSNGREMLGDGFNTTEYTNIPFGEAIFEVIQDERYGYPYYLFKLVETASDEYSTEIGKYLALDGSKKSLTKLVSTIDDSCSWETEGIEEETGYIYLIARTGESYLGMNSDSNKFCCNPNADCYGVTVWTEII